MDLRYYCYTPTCSTGTVDLGTASADGSGSFTTHVVIPLFAPRGPHSLGAIGMSSRRFARAIFTITARPSMAVSPNTGPAGSAITVKGSGFAANESVPIKFYCWPNNCGSGTFGLGTAVTDGSGTFSLTTNVPHHAPLGPHGIGGTGSSSGLFANTVFTVTVSQAITLSPSSGLPGSRFTVNGTGFNANESVSIRFYCWPNNCPVTSTLLIGTGIAGATGAFSTTVSVPRSAPAGRRGVGAIGNSSGYGAFGVFTVQAPASAVQARARQARRRAGPDTAPRALLQKPRRLVVPPRICCMVRPTPVQRGSPLPSIALPNWTYWRSPIYKY